MAETTRNHIFFKRKQSSDNRSHGFGAKFLLKKLSSSDFSYERKSALRLHEQFFTRDRSAVFRNYCVAVARKNCNPATRCDGKIC